MSHKGLSPKELITAKLNIKETRSLEEHWKLIERTRKHWNKLQDISIKSVENKQRNLANRKERAKSFLTPAFVYYEERREARLGISDSSSNNMAKLVSAAKRLKLWNNQLLVESSSKSSNKACPSESGISRVTQISYPKCSTETDRLHGIKSTQSIGVVRRNRAHTAHSPGKEITRLLKRPSTTYLNYMKECQRLEDSSLLVNNFIESLENWKKKSEGNCEKASIGVNLATQVVRSMINTQSFEEIKEEEKRKKQIFLEKEARKALHLN